MNDVDKVKSRIDVAELIREFVEIKKSGRNFKANCPFHSEKSASFYISPERQIWHCFGCGKGGDIFSFLMEYEKLTFAESLEYFAKRLGIELTRTPHKTDQEKKKDRLFSLNHLASQYYHYLLTQHKVGKNALSYLIEERGINPGLIDSFQIGYAPQSEDALVTFLTRKKGYSPQDLILGGLAFQKGRTLSDFFKHRVIFPIHDHQGNIIAFSGRSLDQALPKYINTKETESYKKRQSLYGIFQAKDAIKKEGKVIVVEGEFDVISAHKEGIDHVVAVKGTALTEEQLMLLKRFTQKILFCFDTDTAGVEAQKRSISMIDRLGLSGHVVVLPSGKDPDELLKNDPGEFKKALKNTIPMYDFVINQAAKSFQISTPEGKKDFLKDTLPLLSSIDNEVVKEHYFREVAGLLHTSLESIEKESGKIRAPKYQDTSSQEILPQKPVLLDDYFLALIFQSQKPLGIFGEIEELAKDVPFENTVIRRILDELSKYKKDHTEFDSKLFESFIPEELLDTYNKAFILPLPSFKEEEELHKDIRSTLKKLEKAEVKKRINALSILLQQAEKEQNEKKVEELQNEFTSLASRLKD